jgi:hypothetical protein
MYDSIFRVSLEAAGVQMVEPFASLRWIDSHKMEVVCDDGTHRFVRAYSTGEGTQP